MTRQCTIIIGDCPGMNADDLEIISWACLVSSAGVARLEFYPDDTNIELRGFLAYTSQVIQSNI
jgi:hypothetical protein